MPWGPPLGDRGRIDLNGKIQTNHLPSLCAEVCRKVVFKGKAYLYIHLGVQNAWAVCIGAWKWGFVG